MTFAIVTPSFNKARYLRRCLASVLEQNHPGVDYWLLDNCSTDGSASIIEAFQQTYAGRLNVIVEHDRGQSAAINRGFGLAEGEIMAWLNADDAYVPGTLAKVEKYFTVHPEVGMIYGKARLLNENLINFANAATQQHNLKALLTYDYIAQPSTFWRRSVWDAVGPLDVNLNWGLDWDLFIRISKRFPVAFLDEFFCEVIWDNQTKTYLGGLAKTRELALISRRHGGWRQPTNVFSYYVLALHWLATPWLRRASTEPAMRRFLDRLLVYSVTTLHRFFGVQVMY